VLARPPLLPLVVSLLLVLLGLTLWIRRTPRASPPPAAAPPVWVTDLGEAEHQVVDLPPPAKPYPQQVTTCRPRVHVPINGGCWRKLADGPPCEEAYLWRGACYLPVMKTAAVPTSIQR
jgi:hypothetical protein